MHSVSLPYIKCIRFDPNLYCIGPAHFVFIFHIFKDVKPECVSFFDVLVLEMQGNVKMCLQDATST